MLQLLLIVAALAPPQLHIDLGRDAGLACHAHASLQTRLGALDPLAFDAAGTGEKVETLQATLEWKSSVWVLQLLHRDRSTALVRELQFQRDDCQLVAESAALIIDRYLVALREPLPSKNEANIHSRSPPRVAASLTAQEKLEREKQASRRTSERLNSRPNAPSAAGGNQMPPPVANSAEPERRGPEALQTIPPIPESSQTRAPGADLPPPPMQIAPPPQTQEETSVEVVASPTRAPLSASAVPSLAAGSALAPASSRAELTIALGPAAMLGLSSDARAAGVLEVEHPSDLGAHSFFDYPLTWSSQLFVLGSATSSQEARVNGAPRGEISAQQFLLGVASGPCASGWLRACGGFLLGARATVGSSGGPMLFDQQSALLIQPELGAKLSLDRQLSARFQIRFSLLLGGVPGSGSLQVRGAEPRTLSNVDVAAALLLGYQLF